MTYRATGIAAAFAAFVMFSLSGAAAEQLPWGKTAKEPRVVTPSTTYDPGPVEPTDNYDTSSGTYDQYNDGDDAAYQRKRKTDRYQDDPDYSTYQPANPDQEWSDENDGLYDDQANTRRQRRANTTNRGTQPQFDDTPNPSRFDGTFSANEIVDAGHNAFGQVARGFASVVEYAFQKKGRPNGYIIGQEAGGAVVAGLRYGEGVLYTKNAGTHAVYWQGPSVGYDFGAEGSKTMILVYDMRDPSDIYGRFGGVDGSAYLVGGVGVTFQQNRHVTMAPIRSGVGLRLGANIGYLKYSRVPTWNPF